MSDSPAPPDLRRLHDTLTDALRAIDEACGLLDIAYWVDSGTLLGAIRHQGMIPWDDDIDLTMLREDLSRFVSEAPALLEPAYSVRTPEDDPAIGTSAKIYINGTHIQNRGAELHGLTPTQHDGLYIDIYVTDRVSAHAVVRRAERAAAWLVATHTRASTMRRAPVIRSRAVRLRWTLASWIPHWAVAFLRRGLDRRLGRRSTGALSLGPAGLCYGRTYPYETVFPLGSARFGGMQVPVPADADHYLTLEYGADYMTPPPPGQRATHTDWVRFDVDPLAPAPDETEGNDAR